MADGGVVARQPAILVYKPQITRENWFAEVVDTERWTASPFGGAVCIFALGMDAVYHKPAFLAQKRYSVETVLGLPESDPGAR